MSKRHHSFLVPLMALIALNVGLMTKNGSAQPKVKLQIDPDIRSIPVGFPEDIALTTQTDKQNLQFEWSLDGPGKIIGDLHSPGILYVPPERIDGESAQSTILVKVTDDEGKEATDRVTFTLIPLVRELAASLPPITITERDAESIGQKIWKNDTAGTPEQLIAWNTGETFVSLGIGHFIWYPAGQEGPFKESFPELLQFLHDHNITLPAWLQPASDCPWNTREDFLNSLHSSEMQDLRALLTDTFSHQVQFLIRRSELALPMMLAHLPGEEERSPVRERFYRVAKTPAGIYALVDYVNFKGEGVSATERYQGQGWGLLQVLQQMKDSSSNAVMEFADAAEFVLMRRVKNAPQERNESQWLPGWKNRINTYRQSQ